MLAWNAVKKFVHYFVESKPDNMAANCGIFIRSTKSNDDIIEACTKLMDKSNVNGRIVAVRRDNAYGGVKVYLNGDDIVKDLLGKQFLYETGDLSSIHSLKTYLTVHDAIFSTTEEEFVKELRNIIEEAVGPVLKISKIPISKLHPDIGNGNWRVLLDVPELEDLIVYKKNGLPDEFTIKVPGVHGRLSVTFYCTKCDKDGHTQWRCFGSAEDDAKSVSNSTKEEDSIAETLPRPTSAFYIRDREKEDKEKDNSPMAKPMLKRKIMKKIESEIGKEEVRNYCDSFQLKKSGDVKKKVNDSSSSTMTRPVLSESGYKKIQPPSKKARVSLMNEEDSLLENVPKASSTTNDPDCIYVPCEASPSSSSKHNFVYSPSAGMLARNYVDDYVSTSNQHIPFANTIKSELPSTDENDSDSNQGPSRPKPVQQRKKPAQGIPIVIPERIQTIISQIDDGVLNIQQLTAFFNHVKKKSKPCSFAGIYTPNVAGLKEQLYEIKRRYYMTPERGTNPEIQFMKWFVNILDRFDGTPNSRRKKPTT